MSRDGDPHRSREDAVRKLTEMFSGMLVSVAPVDPFRKNKELNDILLTAFNKISLSLRGGPPLNGEEIEALTLKAENLIFDEGANINCGNFTALSLAAIAGKIRFVEKLIEGRASLDYRDGGATTLISAATGGNLYVTYLVLKKVLEEGRVDSINQQDQVGHTALHMAVMTAQPEIVRLLLLSGADPSVVNNRGITALQIAESGSLTKEIADRRKKIAEIIKSYPSHKGVVNEDVIRKKFAELEFGKNIMVMNLAPISGRPYPEIKALIASKAESLFSLCSEVDVNTKTIALDDPRLDQVSFLHIAAKLGNVGYVKRLLELGADSSAQDSYGILVLRNAVVSGNPEVVLLIFADLKAKGKKDSVFNTKDSRTSNLIIQEALESPIFFRKDSEPEDVEKASEIIRILFSEIDDEDVRNLSIQRIIAIMLGKFGLCKQVEVLSEILPRPVRVEPAKATPPPPPEPKPKPLTPEEELERAQKELFGLLQELEPRMAGKKYRCSAEVVAEIQNAVARGANPNSATESGFTILHFLAKSGNEAAVRGLTARGVKFSESRDGATPLDCAIDASDANMAKIFLEFANVAQVQKSLLKAIGDKQEAVVKAIISDERFISEFSAMEKKSRNIAIEVLRGAANASLNKKLKAQISEFAKVVEEKVSVSHATDKGAGVAQKVQKKTRKKLQLERAEEKARLAADAEEKKKYEEERRRINAERRAAELAAMAAEDFRLVEREQNEVEKRRVDAEKLAKKAAELLLPQAPAIGGGGGGSGGDGAPRPKFELNPEAREFVPAPVFPAYQAVVTVSPTVELPDWLQAIIHKITDLETCESFRLRGSKLYLQCIERSRRERPAHDFDFEILIPGTADLFLKDPEAEKKTREFVKENFGVEGVAVSIFFDRATNKFLSISFKHREVDFAIYDQPPKLDWSIDLDALRLEYKGNPDEPVLKFTSGFETRDDPPIPYPKKTSAEYEPIINFDSYKLLQRLCFFKVIGVIDRELISLIPPKKNCADMAFSEGGRFPEMLRKRLSAFIDNHGFSTEEKILFLTEFKQLITRDEPRTVSKEEFKAFPEKVEEMIQELSGPSVTPRPTTAVGTGESAKFKF